MDLKRKDEVITLKELNRQYFLKVMELCNGNRTEASELLGISLRTVRNYCKEWDIPVKPIITTTHINRTLASDTEYKGMKPVTSRERDDWYNRDRF